uniref:Uncharacterized protein n=2 Tax=Oryza sativa subsp. japonica TaxID=39947 RepID=Q53JC5_ORYSJ|nr:hypothetical protein [Oryza sativa Japonica Group]AAX96707.1 hypothetical protein LOC_Os11g21860 [Oryza sativa Japonica Group]ABA93030.1 hypothetical protein LOC_Os11g21860 [Oryza sativa Japonica Group]
MATNKIQSILRKTSLFNSVICSEQATDRIPYAIELICLEESTSISLLFNQKITEPEQNPRENGGRGDIPDEEGIDGPLLLVLGLAQSHGSTGGEELGSGDLVAAYPSKQSLARGRRLGRCGLGVMKVGGGGLGGGAAWLSEPGMEMELRCKTLIYVAALPSEGVPEHTRFLALGFVRRGLVEGGGEIHCKIPKLSEFNPEATREDLDPAAVEHSAEETGEERASEPTLQIMKMVTKTRSNDEIFSLEVMNEFRVDMVGLKKDVADLKNLKSEVVTP